MVFDIDVCLYNFSVPVNEISTKSVVVKISSILKSDLFKMSDIFNYSLLMSMLYVLGKLTTKHFVPTPLAFLVPNCGEATWAVSRELEVEEQKGLGLLTELWIRKAHALP